MFVCSIIYILFYDLVEISFVNNICYYFITFLSNTPSVPERRFSREFTHIKETINFLQFNLSFILLYIFQ